MRSPRFTQRDWCIATSSPQMSWCGRTAAPVIVDFGAAAAIGTLAATLDSEVTDGYAAPEQYLSDAAEGPWTDVYGLGAIAYRALCGHAPVPAPARLRGEVMPLAMDSAGRHAEALCRAIDWALALEVKERPQTVEDWSAALGISSEEQGVVGPRTSRAVAASRTIRLRCGCGARPQAKVASCAAAPPAVLATSVRRRRAGRAAR